MPARHTPPRSTFGYTPRVVGSIFDSEAFNRNLFFPSPRATPPPPGAHDLRVPVVWDVALHVRIHAGDDVRPVVLLFHGNGEVVADYDAFAARYAAAGADLAVVDYRGYGLSAGRPTLRACLSDSHAVLDAVASALPERPLVVMGRSLGSLCASELCRRPSARVRGYVFESGVADLGGVIRRRGITLEAPLSDEELDTFDPLRKLPRCTAPALVLHGEDDTLIPPSEARAAWDALGTPDKALVMLPGVGHNSVWMHPDYWAALARFVARVTGC